MLIQQTITSSDSISTKFILQTIDNYLIEALYVNYPNKHIICYSTQIGCRNGCKFCYNGIHPCFVRNLSSSEMSLECLTVIAEIFGKEHPNNDPKKPILFSAMGVGDPLDNFDEYVKSIQYLQTIIPARFALSTIANEPDKIRRLIKETEGLDFKLQISLHCAISKYRDELMPKAGKLLYTIMACVDYINDTGRKVEFNITLMDGINDTLECSNALYMLMRIHFTYLSKYITIKINKFNNIKGCDIKGSSKETIELFIKRLTQDGFNVEYYETNGSDIDGACGQLSANVGSIEKKED